MKQLQVLVATMHQTDHSLVERMNIKTDAIIVNQCDKCSFEQYEVDGRQIRWLSLPERGVGLSRNTALSRATGDILLFADDDVVYTDDYESVVLSEFDKHPDADLIVFNLTSLNKTRPSPVVNKGYRLRWYNCLKFGAYRIAVRKESVLRKNVFFSLLFGGGARYQAGEDNMFITQCLQKGLVGYASTKCLGTVKQEESTWFKGYTKKYHHDKGALFKAMYGHWALPVLILFELKICLRKNEFTFFQRMKYDLAGMKDYGRINR